MSVSSVLVPVKGDQWDEELVKLACQFLLPKRGNLHIIHVIEVERGLPIDAVISPASARGEEILQRMEKIARPYRCRIETELVQARQACSAVVQEAMDKNVDAIILGLGYKQRLGVYSLGNTIPYVLKNAPCRVFVWRDSAGWPGHNGL